MIIERPLNPNLELEAYAPSSVDTYPAGQVIYTQDFETSIDSWNFASPATSASRGGPGSYGTISGITTHSGAWFLAVSSSTPYTTKAVRTLTGLVIGRSYTVTAWAGRNNSAKSASIGVTGIGTGTAVTGWVDSTWSWKQCTYTFTATATSHELVLNGTKAAGGTGGVSPDFWDDITVTGAAFSVTHYAWTPLLPEATSLSIKRGGRRDGLGVKTDVGLATFSLLNVQDPLGNDSILAPGQPVRVLCGPRPVDHAAVTIYTNTGTTTTGWTTSFVANGSGVTAASVSTAVAGGTSAPRLQLATSGGTTAVNPTPSAKASRTITGLTPGLTYSFGARTQVNSPAFRARVTLGTGVSTWNAVNAEVDVTGTFVADSTSATLSLEIADNPDVSTTNANPIAYFDNITVVQVAYTEDTRAPIFTGRIAHFNSVYPMDKSTGKSTTKVTVTVADAVQIHGSTMRYGVDLGVEDFETFESRIDRLETSANAPVEVPEVGAPIVRYAL